MSNAVQELELEILKLRAHIEAVTKNAEELSTKFVQANAKAGYIEKCAERRLLESAATIERLADRIDVMCDEWTAQTRDRRDIGENERAELIACIEPFRLARIAEVEVEPAANPNVFPYGPTVPNPADPNLEPPPAADDDAGMPATPEPEVEG